jgi:hypothetical protein
MFSSHVSWASAGPMNVTGGSAERQRATSSR